jgi:DNA-binding MarR family transcriptional regulator
MDVHPSNATRACDRLVAAGLVRRRESTTDRRNLVLELTTEGIVLIDSLNQNRRASIAALLAKVPRSRRRSVVAAMRTLGQAAGETLPTSTWKLGWH